MLKIWKLRKQIKICEQELQIADEQYACAKQEVYALILEHKLMPYFIAITFFSGLFYPISMRFRIFFLAASKFALRTYFKLVA